jgi:hypothetical protein
MSAQARDLRLGIGARELELDVLVKQLEALIAPDLGTGRAQHPVQERFPLI